MSKPDLIAMAMDAMVAINAAIRNIRLYPAGSAMVKASIERVLPPLNSVLERKGALNFAETEKSLLVFDEPLGEKELKKPQAAAFLELLLDFGIRDISFQRGVSAAELAALFSLLSQKPEDIADQGGLHQLCQQEALAHILLDHKVYVALAKDEVITRAAPSKDHGRAETVAGASETGETGTAGGTPGHTASPERPATAVRDGIASLTAIGKGASGSRQSKDLAQLLNILDSDADPKETAVLGKEVATALAAMAPENLARLLADDLSGKHAAGVVAELADRLDDDAFTTVAARLHVTTPKGSGTGVSSAYDALMRSEKGQRLQNRIGSAALAEKQALATHLKEGIERILSGDISPAADPELSRSVPRTVAQLMCQGKQHIAANLIDRLQRGTSKADAATRDAAAAMLAETSGRLIALLDSKAAIDPKFKDQAQVEICQVLGAIGAAEAVPVLTAIVKQNELSRKDYARDVLKAAEAALAAISGASAKSAPATPAPEDDDREQAVDAFVATGDTDAAVKLLFELIVEQAKKRNFPRAEALRDKMMTIDEMALNEIVKAAEIIEEEKSAALDGGIADLWESLRSRLSPEEANALFYAMDSIEFPVDTVILKQGQINDRLFFINQGSVRAVYREDGDKETLLKTYKKGEVCGVDSFFDIKVCSTSLAAMTPVTAMVLPRSALAVWKETQPGLEPKLADHFLNQAKEHELLKEAGISRRRFTRYQIGGKLLIQIIDAKRMPVGKPFKGELSDVSAGGLSFLIKTSKAETARMLLGRRLKLAFAIPAPDAPLKITQTGTVLGVSYLLHTDYAVQVRFIEPLNASARTALEGLETAEPV